MSFFAELRRADFYEFWSSPRSDGAPRPQLDRAMWLVLGDVDRFYDQVEADLVTTNKGVREWLRYVWLYPLGSVRSDPRFLALAEQFGLIKLWEAEGYPPGCRPVDGEPPHLDCEGMRR